jgi:hypothetical protein
MALTREQERDVVNLLNKLTGAAVNNAIRDLLIGVPIAIRDRLNGAGVSPTFSPAISKGLDDTDVALLTNVSGDEAIRAWQRYTKGISAQLKFSTIAEGLPIGESDFLNQGEVVSLNAPAPEVQVIEGGAVEVQIGPVRVRWEYD